MPNYTLIIYNKNFDKIRQFSSTQSEVKQEWYNCLNNPKWKDCYVSWGTKKNCRVNLLIK